MPAAQDDPIRIVPYDRSWPQQFLAEQKLLTTVLKPWLAGPVEHIGSTAVPGLSAKPVIDIMAGVESLNSSKEAFERLRQEQYVYFPYKPDTEHWFCKPGPSLRTHHLHLVPYESPVWRDQLRFRDALRNDPLLAKDYALLKQRLAEIHTVDREAYTEAKGPFIARTLAALS